MTQRRHQYQHRTANRDRHADDDTDHDSTPGHDHDDDRPGTADGSDAATRQGIGVFRVPVGFDGVREGDRVLVTYRDSHHDRTAVPARVGDREPAMDPDRDTASVILHPRPEADPEHERRLRLSFGGTLAERQRGRWVVIGHAARLEHDHALTRPEDDPLAADLSTYRALSGTKRRLVWHIHRADGPVGADDLQTALDGDLARSTIQRHLGELARNDRIVRRPDPTDPTHSVYHLPGDPPAWDDTTPARPEKDRDQDQDQDKGQHQGGDPGRERDPGPGPAVDADREAAAVPDGGPDPERGDAS